jgi:hypothetical protein
MRNITRILCSCLVLFGLQNTNAQLLKKLKEKINNKVEQVEQKIENKVGDKIDETVDGTIDSIFEGNKNKPTNPESSENSEYSENSDSSETENKSYSGTVGLNHAQNYGSFQINTLDNLKIERTNQGYNFYGSWFSHEVDVFDGYKLEVLTDESLELEKTYTFTISEGAYLRLGYDPELPATKGNTNYERGISDEYQNIDLSSGFIKVTIHQDQSFEIDFSGQAEFTKRTRTASNEVEESFYTTSVMGDIQGTNPQFIDNKTITKTNNSTASSGSMSNTSSNTNSVVAKDAYAFTYETIVEMTVPDQDDTYKISYLLNPNADYMATKADMSDYGASDVGGESVIVMDGDQTFIFIDAPGMKMQMSGAQMGNQQASNPSEQMENYDYTNLNKTGNTKTVIGYTCYEYVMSDNKNSIQLWVAPELVIPNWFMQNQDVIEGHILEYTVDSKDGKMTVTTMEIKENINKTLNPSEYKKMF